MNKETCVILDQILFGYDKGHSQLTSSLSKTLPKSMQSLLLRLSDASVSGYTAKSPSYLTGYPLREIGAYALSRTWPAPEMSRPGCVWTHTLIIGYADLARIQSLAMLESVFQRPDYDLNTLKYRESIKINPRSISATNVQVNESHITQLVSELYGKSSTPAIIDWTENVDLAFYLVWSQQWPKLRRSFSFRSYGHEANLEKFDLLAIPSESSVNDVNTNYVSQNWVKPTVHDILTEKKGELHEFMWRFGADSAASVDSYKPLATMWFYLNTNTSAEGFRKAWEELFLWKGGSPEETST